MVKICQAQKFVHNIINHNGDCEHAALMIFILTFLFISGTADFEVLIDQ